MTSRGGLPPSPPISVARSSNGTSLYPASGPEGGPPGAPPGAPPGGRKYNMQQLEAQLADHHRVLKDYLAESLRQDKTYMPHNRARDKLLRLSPIQFQELSTDVYDELLRREDERVAQSPQGDGRNIPRFLLPRNNFHPKRNQARQKLSTLPQKKFRELATDVLFELERRFPRFTGAERVANRGASRPPTAQGYHGVRRPSNASSIGGSYSPGIVENGGRGTSGPRQFQSNTMVPNKGRMVEDDDGASGDEEDPYGFNRRSSKRTTNRSLPYSVRENPALDAKVEELEALITEKDQALEQERQRSSNLTSDLETQLKSVKSLNESLQDEIDRMRADREADDWKAKYQNLQQEYRDLREAAEDMRQDTAGSMQEVRSLTQRVTDKHQVEEHLANQNAELKEQLEDWKERYAKTRAHLRTLKASSTGLFIQQPTAAQFVHDGSILDSRGAVKDVSVTRFQAAVDEIIQLAHNGKSADAFSCMKSLVACVRAITGDVSKTNPRGPEDFIKRRKKLEARIASTTNHMITVCQNHASADGLAPVAIVDAAVAHLTSAVVDYVKMMKVKPSSEADLDGHDFR